jgi:hypothetical protein
MKTLIRIVLLLSLVVFGSSLVLGETINPAALVNNPGAPSNFGTPPGPFSVGWSFQLLQPYVVAYLGWYQPGESLAESHDVNLWQCPDAACASPVSLTPLASATIDNSDFLSDGFRWEALASPVALTTGYYVISGFSGIVDPYIHAASGPSVSVTFDPSFRWIDGRWVAASGAVFPDSSNGLSNLTYFGPNLASVPEPGGFWLLGGAMLLMVLPRLKRRA